MSSDSISNLWKSLDKLASENPKEYKKLIEKAQAESKEYMSKIPKVTKHECWKLNIKKWNPKCIEKWPKERKSVLLNAQYEFYLNICTTERLNPTDWDEKPNYTIDILIDELRPPANVDLKQIIILDALLHPNVIERSKSDTLFYVQLERFLLETVENTFGLTFSKAVKRIDEEYYDKFIWDPLEQMLRTGQAETLKFSQDENLNLANLKLDKDGIKLATSTHEEEAIEEQSVLKITTAKGTLAKPLIEEINPEEEIAPPPLIQEVVEPETNDHNAVTEDREEISKLQFKGSNQAPEAKETLDYKIIESDGAYSLIFHNITDLSMISFEYSDNIIRYKIGSSNWQSIFISAIKHNTSPVAKFKRKKQELEMKFEK